jgi:hypothetical protein
MANQAHAPEPPATNSLAGEIVGFLKWLIELVWNKDPALARPITVCAVAATVATIDTFVTREGDGGIVRFASVFGLVAATAVLIYWLTNARTAPVQAGAAQPAAPAHPAGAVPQPTAVTSFTPPTWASRLFLVFNLAFTIAFGTPQLASRFPEVDRALYDTGLYFLSSPSCVLRPFSDCTTLRDEVTKTEGVTVARGDYTVYIQFVGIERNGIKTLAKNLNDAGWKVPKYELGGEEIATAKGRLEVRYGSADDKAAAEQLAAEISTQKVTTEPLKTKLLPIVKKGVLEVWISG